MRKTLYQVICYKVIHVYDTEMEEEKTIKRINSLTVHSSLHLIKSFNVFHFSIKVLFLKTMCHGKNYLWWTPHGSKPEPPYPGSPNPCCQFPMGASSPCTLNHSSSPQMSRPRRITTVLWIHLSSFLVSFPLCESSKIKLRFIYSKTRL